MTFDSITRGPLESNLPDNIDADRNGSLVGGAHVPGQGCFCNCGLRASLNLGGIEFDWDDGIDSYAETLTHVDYWSWVDASRPTLGASEYVAYLDFTPAENGCDPAIVVVAAFPPAVGDHGAGLGGEVGPDTERNVVLYVSTTGEGFSGVVAYDGGTASWLLVDGFVRPGHILADARGTYSGNHGTAVVSTQTIGTWRDRPGDAP